MSRLDRMFSVDLRSLAALRIVLGFLVLADIVGRFPSLEIFYTDDGVLPRRYLERFDLDDLQWSFYKLDGSEWLTQVLFGLTALAAIAMILGFQTRVATVLAWALIVSVQVRNPFLGSGADILLRVLLFWAMLLPLGAAWSLDALRRKSKDAPYSISFTSLASVGLILQIAAMYWFTAILKSGSTWRTDGTALYYATGAEFIRPFGEFLHGYPDLLRVLTHTSLGFEFLVPFLFFSPWWHDRLRIVAVGLTMAFHFGIWLIMDVGLFPWISAFCMVALLPSSFWDRIVPRFQRRFSITGDEAIPTHSGHQLESTALLNGFAAVCIVLVAFWNLTTVSPLTIPREVRAAGYVLAVDQGWSMFAPNPTQYTRWVIVGGVLANYDSVNLVPAIQSGDFSEPTPYTIEQPKSIVNEYYRDKYWRKYFEHLIGSGNEAEQLAMAGYICTHWNATHDGDERLSQLSLMYIRIRTLPNNERGNPDIQTLQTFACY